MAKFQLNPGVQGSAHLYEPNRVRIGSISIFALMIVICLAVLAVLAFSTASASLTMAQRQATATTELYLDEVAAQEFLANVDALLADQRAPGVAQEDEPAVELARNEWGNVAYDENGLVVVVEKEAGGKADAGESSDASAAAAEQAVSAGEQKSGKSADANKAADNATAEKKSGEAADSAASEQASPADGQKSGDGGRRIIMTEGAPKRVDGDKSEAAKTAGAANASKTDEAARTAGAANAGKVDVDVIERALPDLCAAARQASADRVEVTAHMYGNRVAAEFSCQNGRLLNIVITVRDNATYRIDRWKMSAVQNEEPPEGQFMIIDDGP